MILTIASGKGGTGKTTVAVNLATALAAGGNHVHLMDCDVEEPNDHLFVRPTFTEEHPVTVLKPRWSPNTCTGCGACAAACNYNAIAVVKDKVIIFNDLCHSCGACAYVCPTGSITEHLTPIGKVQHAPQHHPFRFTHGILNIGEALAPMVVGAVRQQRDATDPESITIIDAAPGTACSVVAAVKNSDIVLLVTEPTPFGLNDLKLAVGLTLNLAVPTAILINRSDGTDTIIADYAAASGIPIAGRIPFSRAYAEAYSSGTNLSENFPELRANLLHIFDNLKGATPPPPTLEKFSITPSANPAILPSASATPPVRHREITVISGKGGTGKTTVTASFAQLAKQPVLADNDVDAADLHLLLRPVVREMHDFIGGVKATIMAEQCTACGLCAKLCHFNAISADGPANTTHTATYRIDPMACEGCGLCPRACPVNAITSEPNITGHWFISDTPFGPMAHARLGIAEENSGRLVAMVRDQAASLAAQSARHLIIGDGPPGTGCPVIASVSGTDLVVIVTEPTVSGVHDLQRVLELTHHFQVPATVIINKCDLNSQQAKHIETLCSTHGATISGHIPFDPTVNSALMASKTIIDYAPDSPAAQAIATAWQNILQ